MKISNEYPPNYDQIKAYFKLNPNVVFTYGDTLYNPRGGEIEPNLMEHELTHAKQQGDDPEGWWKHYLADPTFRLQQELEAYRAQYKHLKENSSRDYRRKVLNQISKDLAGPIYGNLINRAEAEAAIKEYA